MKRNKPRVLQTRIPDDAMSIIAAMVTDGYPLYKVLRDIIVSYAYAAQRPPLRDDTMQLLYLTVEAAGYNTADALVQDLCRSLERAIRAARGELREDEAEVDNDILEMFTSVINEKELTIHKHA